MSEDWIETEDSAPVEAPSAPPAPAAVVAEPATEVVTPADPATPDEDDAPTERDRHGRWRSRGKQAAGPEDVPRIRELTKKLRGVETELAALKAPKAAPTPEPVFTLPAAPQPLPSSPEPTIEQFTDKDDPYGAWQRALAKWDRQQEHLQAVSGQQQQHFQQTTHQAEAYWQGVRSTHAARLQAAVAANPAAAQTLQSVKVQPPPLLDLAIMLDNQSADVALFLASHPAQLDELTLITTSQPVNQQNVEITRRRLHQMMTAVPSGSVASSPRLAPAPRPPNPLRTAPMTTGDAVPGDDDSVEAHEKYYAHRSGRRR